jgi:hypothetical protein
MREGIDYYTCFEFVSASLSCAQKVSGGISIINIRLTGAVYLNYQTLGGSWVSDTPLTLEIVSDTLHNPRALSWEQIANLPEIFPPSVHVDDVNDLKDMGDVVGAINALTIKIAENASSSPPLPIRLYQTKQQVGLGNVDNFKTATLQQAKLGEAHNSFVTPAGVTANVAEALLKFVNSFSPRFRSASIPSSGNFNQGNYVENTQSKVETYKSVAVNGKFDGQKYVLKGWIRLTTGSSHVLGVDWVRDIAFLGD